MKVVFKKEFKNKTFSIVVPVYSGKAQLPFWAAAHLAACGAPLAISDRGEILLEASFSPRASLRGQFCKAIATARHCRHLFERLACFESHQKILPLLQYDGMS